MRSGSPPRAAHKALALGVLFAAGCLDQLPAKTQGDLTTRLELLCEELDARREQLHIPGMALAVVRGNEVLLARGFGWRDIDRQLPATEQTLFAIGSTTKTFTAILLGMLAEEGKLDFDEPVTTYIPGFSLTDPRAGEKVTLRDLLSHRTGLSRMPMVWCAGQVEREAALECMQRATLLRQFRGDFNYSNMNYLAAGAVAERVAGTTWEALLAERLLEPLGMTTATPASEALRDPERASRGYRWNARTRAFEADTPFNLRTIAPAGAINASVVDMSCYLRMLLSGGALNGVQLVDPDTLEDLWDREALIGVQRWYGSGWMIGQWRGQRVVDHGGNIDGFCSTFALLPEEGLGFSLLMNVKMSPLQQEAPELVWEALLGEFTPPNRVPEAQLAPYVGTFASADPELRLEVSIRSGRLHTRRPTEPWRELQWPDATGRWQRTTRATFSVEFEPDDDGRIDALTLRQRRGRETALRRIDVTEEDQPDSLPQKTQQLLNRMRAAVGADAAADLTFRLEGTATLPHQGLTGHATFLGSGPEHFVQRLSFGDFGYQDTCFDGETAWVDTSMSAFLKLEDARRELVAMTDAMFFADWATLFRNVEHTRGRKVRGRPTELLEVEGRELPPFKVYVDTETAHIVRIKLTVPIDELGINVPFTIDLSDYREVGSVRLPFHRVTNNLILGDEIVQFEEATPGVEITDSSFAPRSALASAGR